TCGGREIGAGGVEAGQVVFEEVDNPLLLLKGWNRYREPAPEPSQADLALRDTARDQFDLSLHRWPLHRESDESGIEVVDRAQSYAVRSDYGWLRARIDRGFPGRFAHLGDEHVSGNRHVRTKLVRLRGVHELPRS